MDRRSCLVTGISGFIGGRVGLGLAEAGHLVRGAVRNSSDGPAGVGLVEVGDLSEPTNWSRALDGIDCVIHCAARTQGPRRQSDESDTLLRRVNVHATKSLAEQAASVGVRRLMFLSSIKVNGEGTALGEPFSASDPPSPADAYGRSKLEAEEALHEISARTGMEVVIVRPPLVYGAQARGNFARLLKLVARGAVVPLGAVANRRSLVFVENLVDLLVQCVEDPRAAGQTFLVSDGEDLSTPELLRRLAKAMNRRVIMVPVPPRLLRIGGRLTGFGDEVDRLVGSLQVDIAHTCSTLEWRPPVSVDRALENTASAYMGAAQAAP